MPALVGSHCDSLNVLFDGALGDLRSGSIVTEMNDLGSGGLQQAPHDVDRRVVPVEQGSGSHEADMVLGTVDLGFLRHRLTSIVLWCLDPPRRYQLSSRALW